MTEKEIYEVFLQNRDQLIQHCMPKTKSLVLRDVGSTHFAGVLTIADCENLVDGAIAAVMKNPRNFSNPGMCKRYIWATVNQKLRAYYWELKRKEPPATEFMMKNFELAKSIIDGHR